jgi:CHAT domain-containing protein
LANYPPKTGLLLYEHKEGRLRALLVTTAGLVAEDAVAIDAGALTSAIDELRSALGVRPEGGRGLVLSTDRGRGEPPARLEAATRRASEIALPGAVARAAGALQHLVVVPTLELGTFPFPMLAPFGDASRVVDRMSVTIAASLDDLRTPPPAWELATGSAVVVGDPLLGGGVSLPALPGARREANMVASRIGTRALLGAAATESAVAAASTSANLLYLASHGIADERDPLDGSFLALASDAAADGRWTPREIQRAGLGSARLAVLSACQTGRGGAHGGGIIGLARAFHLAGVRRVMMSLWDVDDEGTYELMCRMLGHLASDFPAEALRRAMLEQRAAGAPASVWATFTVFGTPG